MHKYAVRDLGEDSIFQPDEPGRSAHFLVVVAGTLFPDKRKASALQQADLSRADVGNDDTPALSLRPFQSQAQGPSFQLR